ISSIAWSGIIPALEAKKIDAIVGGMSITEERKKKVNFTDSYFASGLSVVVNKKNKDIKDMKSLEGKTIAVKIATSAKEIADNIKNAKVIVYDTNDVIYNAVIAGKADAMISDTPVNDYTVARAQGKDKLKTAFIHNSDDFYGIAVRKKDKQLLNDLNEALKTIKQNGTYNKISMEWFGKKLVK
ncbi:MAG: transporter substrate-binding domain-containing protein, partial [Rickettsiales bacterium]|nr:transporter substrate-binding domain-containing protein [Rickettsiales bacterium]